MNFKTIIWDKNAITILDQRRLPAEEIYTRLNTVPELIEAISVLAVRGAPALGVAGAMGVALAAVCSKAQNWLDLSKDLAVAAEAIKASRPTAVNLAWGVNKQIALAESLKDQSVDTIRQKLIDNGIAVLDHDIAVNKKIGKNGAELLPQTSTVLTHCNAGALCAGGYGTALGVIYAAKEAGKTISVFADETRPLLQGARLTAWELHKNNVPVTVICDNMAATVLRSGKIQAVITGADRIAANGDVANKIGTYGLAILAKHHNVPFYVAAPLSTIDFATATGQNIPIEERAAQEIARLGTSQLTPDGIAHFNPAFDVTPAELVKAIITEEGVFAPQELHRLSSNPDR